MCDRYSLRTNLDQLANSFAAKTNGTPAIDSPIDIVPGQSAAVLRLASSGQRIVSRLRWGMAPVWPAGCDNAVRKTTAAAETLLQTPAFRVAIRRFRCLVPADAFYESRTRENGQKQSYLVSLKQEGAFAFAGLWDLWIYGEQPLETFTIITVKSGADTQDRMPVILPRNLYSQWLSPQSQPEHLLSSLQPYAHDALRSHPVADMHRNQTSELPDSLHPVAA